VQTSTTPEDKFGPTGYDAPATSEENQVRYIPAGQALDYRIEFWNKEDAPVPTQDAIIVEPVDPNVFDLSTVEFTRIGFLKWDVPLSGGQAIDTRIDLRPDMNLAVEVKAGYELDIPGFTSNTDGAFVWWFHAIDPETGQWPEDPMAGFLPPYNPETGYEIGWVEFTVEPKEGLPSGTRIENQAFVEFDFAGDLPEHPAPKEGPWVNTIDAGIPDDASQVEALPPTTTSTEFTVRWSGQDETNGSGIASYDIYVSIDDGPFALWREGITETSDTYTGVMGHTYAFYSIATDNVGHREPEPLVADTTTAAMGSNPWHNYLLPCDVNGDGEVTPSDVLDIINDINRNGSRQLPMPPPANATPFYPDVNDDNQWVTPQDVLDVINCINRQAGGSGEAEAPGPASQAGLRLPTVAVQPAGRTRPSALADRSTSRWYTGQPDMLVPLQTRGIANDPSPWSGHSFRHGVGYDATDRDELLVKASPDLRRPDELDADLTYLDSILPDIAEDIASVWQAL